MQVEVIYRRQDGSETSLEVRTLSNMPPTGEPFQVDDRHYTARGYTGPDAQGLYRLVVEDRPNTLPH